MASTKIKNSTFVNLGNDWKENKKYILRKFSNFLDTKGQFI